MKLPKGWTRRTGTLGTPWIVYAAAEGQVHVNKTRVRVLYSVRSVDDREDLITILMCAYNQMAHLKTGAKEPLPEDKEGIQVIC